MIQVELDDMLDFHRHWLRDNRFGTRADFTDLTLKNLSFLHRDLTSVIFNGAGIFSCNFSNANLSEIMAIGAHFSNCDFTDASFKNAYLRQTHYTLNTFLNTDLWNVLGDGIFIISLQLGGKNVCYTSEILQINCYQFDIDKIWTMKEDIAIRRGRGSYTDEDFDKMAAWWAKWKDIIHQIVKNNPAKPVN